MNSSGRKVIKSEEVKFLQAPGGIASSLSRDLGDPSLLSDGFDPERVKDALTKKVKLVEQESYEKGLSDGVQKGRELQRNETLQTLQTMASVVTEISKLKKSILENAEQQIIQLSLAIAEKVIHLEVTTNREVIRCVLKGSHKKYQRQGKYEDPSSPAGFSFYVGD